MLGVVISRHHWNDKICFSQSSHQSRLPPYNFGHESVVGNSSRVYWHCMGVKPTHMNNTVRLPPVTAIPRASHTCAIRTPMEPLTPTMATCCLKHAHIALHQPTHLFAGQFEIWCPLTPNTLVLVEQVLLHIPIVQRITTGFLQAAPQLPWKHEHEKKNVLSNGGINNRWRCRQH